MAKPSTIFEFATDSNYATGPDAGTPTKVAPSAGEIDSGFVRGTASVAQHVNYLFGQIEDWLGYLNNLTTEPEFHDADFAWGGEHTFYQDITLGATAEPKFASARPDTTWLDPISKVRSTSSSYPAAIDTSGTGPSVYVPNAGSQQMAFGFKTAPGTALTGLLLGMRHTGGETTTWRLYRILHVTGGSPSKGSPIATGTVTGTGALDASATFTALAAPTHGTWLVEVDVSSGLGAFLHSIRVEHNDSAPGLTVV